MNLILILMTCFLVFIQINDSIRYSLLIDDELYPYTLDENVSTYMEYFNMEDLIFEQIDDDKVKLGGHSTIIKSMDPTLPLQANLLTQYREKSTWREGLIRLAIPNMCNEFLNPSQFWYNMTKLWTNCPPQIGEQWIIESQIINFQIDVPPSFSKGPWRGYVLFTQGLFGGITKFGAMYQMEFIEVV